MAAASSAQDRKNGGDAGRDSAPGTVPAPARIEKGWHFSVEGRRRGDPGRRRGLLRPWREGDNVPWSRACRMVSRVPAGVFRSWREGQHVRDRANAGLRAMLRWGNGVPQPNRLPGGSGLARAGQAVLAAGLRWLPAPALSRQRVASVQTGLGAPTVPGTPPRSARPEGRHCPDPLPGAADGRTGRPGRADRRPAGPRGQGQSNSSSG